MHPVSPSSTPPAAPAEEIPPPQPTSRAAANAWHRRTFASFAVPNYRWFFFGQGTSVVGLWMRDAAQGWLVFLLTGSYASLGLVTAVSRGTLGAMTPLGGLLADRMDKRRLLILLSVLSSAGSLALGALVLSGGATILSVMVLAGLAAAVKGFEIPARQAFVVEMVGREHLANAVALNTAMFNSARVLGPLLAGFVMYGSETGIAACFLADGVSYFAILFSLTRIRPLPVESDRSEAGFGERLREGVDYAWRTRRVRMFMILLVVFTAFGWSYLTILPAFAKTELGLDTRGFGVLMALNGLGALLGALWVAGRAAPESRRALRRSVFGAVGLSAAAVAAFAYSPTPALASGALVVAGFGAIGFFSQGQTLVQLAVPDRLRGRVMSLWALLFIGGMALGGFLIGWAAERFGARAAVAGSGAACIVLSAALWASLPKADD